MQPCLEDNRSFFQKLQNAEGLDLRDNRGKRHDLAIVLSGLSLALLSNRDGSLSSIHRHLKNHYERLMMALKLEPKSAISRAQLPRALEKVSVKVFDSLLFENYGQRLDPEQRKWFALDGKEFKGSIEKGAKRGEALVQAVEHETLQVQSQTYYSGKKESEVPAVRRLLQENGLCAEKISLDALHCKTKTLEPIVLAGGSYLVGLKKNQQQMFEQVQEETKRSGSLYEKESVEKGHGRIDYRKYQVFDLEAIEKAPRWDGCQIKTAIKVMRERFEIKSGKKSQETSYYLSNESEDLEQLCGAVRKHWRVETNNHVRDVTLREDQMRSKKSVSTEF